MNDILNSPFWQSSIWVDVLCPTLMVVGRILIVCRPALMQYRWFVRVSGWVTRTRDRIHHAIEATAVWRGYKALRARIHALTARFRGGTNWWSAARQMVRRKAV